MSGIRLVLAVLLTLVAQVALVNRIDLWGIRPDLALLLLVFLAQRRGPVFGTVLGFCIGLLEGLLQPHTLGMQCLAKSVLGFGIGKLSQQLVAESLVLLAVLLGLSVLVHDAIFLLAYTHLSLPRFFSMYFTIAIPTAIYTALAGGLIAVVASAIGGGGGLMARREGRLGS
jgi:rod shape-determining protein MreD